LTVLSGAPGGNTILLDGDHKEAVKLETADMPILEWGGKLTLSTTLLRPTTK
jgi:hypothetical protein